MHKRTVQIQKLARNLFLTKHGHNVRRQQRQLSKFLMRYQQFASHAYCGASFQDGVAAGKGFLWQGERTTMSVSGEPSNHMHR